MKSSAFERLARFGRDPFALLIVVLAGLGTAHILVRTAAYGGGGHYDSVRFLSTAMNFLAGEGWRDFWGFPMVDWPPLFPLLLAALGWVGIEPQAAGRWINATAFGLTILAAGGYLRSNLRSQWLAVVATATLAASLPLSKLASHFFTDSLFVLLTLLALIQLTSFLNRRMDAPLWWAAGFTALAALTRYPGVVLIGTGVLLLLPRARLKQTLGFGAISSMPLLGVLAHNWAVPGHQTRATGNALSAGLGQIVKVFGEWVVRATGRPNASGQSLSEGLSQTVNVFREWVVPPPNAPDGVAYLLWLAVAAVGLAGATVVLHTTQMRNDDSGRSRASHFHLGPAIPFGGFALAYSIFMVAVVPFTVEQGIDSRYLLPVYVPLLLAAVFLLDRFLSIEAAGWRVAVRYGLASLILLGALSHTGLSAHRNLRITARALEDGYSGFWADNTAFWQPSETLNYIRTNHMDGRIYSNDPFLAWSEEKIAAPGKYRMIPHGKSKRKGWTEIEAGAYIVWFDRLHNPRGLRYDSFDFRLLPDVETVAELADGVVLRVLRRTTVGSLDIQRHARKQRYVDQLIQQASQRVERAGWTVCRTGRKLTYVKKPCTLADVQAKFVLHVTPADLADLPAHRQRYGFDNLDFYFDRSDVRRDNPCVEIIRLPAYPIRRIRVGQWISADNRTLWDAEFSMAGD